MFNDMIEWLIYFTIKITLVLVCICILSCFIGLFFYSVKELLR